MTVSHEDTPIQLLPPCLDMPYTVVNSNSSTLSSSSSSSSLSAGSTSSKRVSDEINNAPDSKPQRNVRHKSNDSSSLSGSTTATPPSTAIGDPQASDDSTGADADDESDDPSLNTHVPNLLHPLALHASVAFPFSFPDPIIVLPPGLPGLPIAFPEADVSPSGASPRPHSADKDGLGDEKDLEDRDDDEDSMKDKEESADGGGDKPFKCKMPGCNKVYKNPGGLKYHMVHGHAEDTGIPEINMIIHKPYLCSVEECGKRYKNLNGLKVKIIFFYYL
jgi:transcription factor SFP1